MLRSFINENATVGTKIKYRIQMIEYQDGMENWDIPYFTGMQSVKMPVLTTTGKNLSKGLLSYSTDQATFKLCELVNGKTYTLTLSNYNIGGGLIELKSSVTNSSYVIQKWGEKVTTFTVPNDGIIYNGILLWKSGFRYDNNTMSFQLEEGTVSTSYEPHKSITLSTPSDLELRKVGEVQDEVNVMTGEVVERIGEIVLDGSERWSGSSFVSDNHYCAYTSLEKTDNKLSTNIICDSLPSKNILSSSADYEGCIINSTNDDRNYGNLVIKIKKSKLSSSDTNGLKAYLKSNPITIQYELAEPTTKTINLSVVNQDGNETKLRTFDDTTHVLLQSEAGPNPGASLTVRTKIPSGSSTSLLMDELSTNQQQLEATANEQSNNVDATMIATTEIYEETL